jgi:hypothetical protein
MHQRPRPAVDPVDVDPAQVEHAALTLDQAGLLRQPNCLQAVQLRIAVPHAVALRWSRIVVSLLW